MKNKEIKKALIQNKSFERFKHFRNELIKNNQYELIDKSDTYGITDDELKMFLQLLQCNKKQRQKIQHHLSFLLKQKDYDIYFCTFTFKNGKLKNPTDWNLLKDRIKKYIFPFIEDIIINVDYGTKNERMHAHAIIAVKKGTGTFVNQKRKLKNGNYITGKKLQTDYLLKYEKNVGNYDAELIKSFDDIENIQEREKAYDTQNKKLANYMNKLTSHALKVKQSYISTKKGTRYQRFKVANNDLERISKCCGYVDIKDYLFTYMVAFEPVDTIEQQKERENQYLSQIELEKQQFYEQIELNKKRVKTKVFD